tara:strand:- start:651 stop:1409 length:759 start_codon:yes stop_codon:yes gene_type:complete
MIMTTSRDELLYETKLRDLIRKAIPVVLDRQEKKNYLAEQEEKKLRSLIRKLITETEVSEPEESPHKSTGINILEDLLKKIIPIIEIDFKKLTTEDIQRISFRAHILQAVENTLAPARITDRAVMKEQEDINVSVDDPEEFIDVRGETDKQDEEPSDEEKFGIEGEDETGRDMAFSTFKRIEANIIDSWEILYSDEDKELFYDYLITNLKLYFDKFEDELKANLPEPTTPEYEKEVSSHAGTGEDDELGLGI